MPLIHLILIRRLNIFQAKAKEIAAEFDREVSSGEVLSIPQFAPSNALNGSLTSGYMKEFACRLKEQIVPM